MNRRHWILAGAGVAAATTGLALQVRRSTQGAAAAPATAASGGSGPSVAAADSNDFLWRASFPRPEGGALAMASLLGQPVVLNFWATWCPPCIKEMPEIDRFAEGFAARGGAVVGLAVDSPKAVRAFLERTPVRYPIGLAGFEGTDLSRKLGNDSGALPFTAVLSRRGGVLHRRLGTTSLEELEGWTRGL